MRKKTFYSFFLHLCNLIDNVSGWCAFQMPVFITAERLMILFYPFSYKNKITLKRTILLISCTFTLIFVWAAYRASESRDFSSAYKPCFNGTNFNLLQHSSLCAVNIAWFRNTHERSASKIFTSTVMFLLPVLLTVCGNIIIIRKLYHISRRRNSIHGKQFSVVKQTQGVVLVCTSFVLCVGTILILQSGLIEKMFQDCGIEKFRKATYIKEVVNLLSVINFATDPIIYIIFNPKLRPLFGNAFVTMNNAVSSVFPNRIRMSLKSSYEAKSEQEPKENLKTSPTLLTKTLAKHRTVTVKSPNTLSNSSDLPKNQSPRSKSLNIVNSHSAHSVTSPRRQSLRNQCPVSHSQSVQSFMNKRSSTKRGTVHYPVDRSPED